MKHTFFAFLPAVVSMFMMGLISSCQADPEEQTAAEEQVAATTPPPSVLVLPFRNLSAMRQYDWIGQAVQQNLTADLSRTQRIGVITPATLPSGAPAADLQSAMEAARKAQAGLVVYGSYQYVEPELRITGELVDAQRSQVLGTLKATGPVKQLFALEDDLANQLKDLLNRNDLMGAKATATWPYVYDAYAGYPYYSYYYPYYSAAYPYCWYRPWYPSFFVFAGVGFHHHHFHHGFDIHEEHRHFGHHDFHAAVVVPHQGFSGFHAGAVGSPHFHAGQFHGSGLHAEHAAGHIGGGVHGFGGHGR